MPRDEDDSRDGDEPIPIREVIPLPVGFPNDATDRLDAGDVGVFNSASRPIGSQAAKARDTMVDMVMAGQFLSDYDSEWMFQEREMMLPKLQVAHARLVESGEATPRQLLEVRRFSGYCARPRALDGRRRLWKWNSLRKASSSTT